LTQVQTETGAAVARPLQGQHAIVTGASRGIGAAIAAQLGRLGADVTLMSLPEPELADQVALIKKAHGVRTQGLAVDFTDEPGTEKAFAEAAQAFGAAQILVNNAGIALAAPFSKTDRAFWQRMIDIDLTGPFLCTRQVSGAMLKSGYGRIISVVSTAGHTGYPYCAAYCAAKHGMIGLTRALAREYAKTGVTVNAVCPGYADTDVVAKTIDNIVAKTGRTREQALAELTEHNPQGRLIKPAEVAEAVGFLSLPSSASITGQSLMVDGGELM
jgi:NAD(P)-dependent dehydrogenase (short-subunit alcohol dehydrogenase family)